MKSLDLSFSLFGHRLGVFSLIGYLIICIAALLQSQIWTKPHGPLRHLMKFAVFGITGIVTSLLIAAGLNSFGLRLDIRNIVYYGLWLGLGGAGVPYRLRLAKRARQLLKPTEEQFEKLMGKRLECEKQVHIAENAKKHIENQERVVTEELTILASKPTKMRGNAKRERLQEEKVRLLDELKAAKKRNDARLRSAKRKLSVLEDEQLAVFRSMKYYKNVDETMDKRLSPERLARITLIIMATLFVLGTTLVIVISGAIWPALTFGLGFALLGNLCIKGLFLSEGALFALIGILGESGDKAPWFSWRGFVSAFGGVFISQLVLWVLTSPHNWFEGAVYALVFSFAAGGAGIVSARVYEEVDTLTTMQITRIGVVIGMVGGALQLIQ